MEVRPILYFFRPCLCSTSQSIKRLESKPELDTAFGDCVLDNTDLDELAQLNRFEAVSG